MQNMFFFLCLINGIHAQDKFTQLAQKLDLYTTELMTKYNIPGVAIALVHDDKIIHAKGYGVTDIQTKKPVTPDTVFGILSCTKAFTATLIATLVDQGKLTWDDKVIQHLPDFKMYDPYVTQEITIRDLLCHRCGISEDDACQLWTDCDTQDEVIIQLRFVKPHVGFRTQFDYNNIMYVVAGKIIEIVTAKSFEENLQEVLFTPLSMHSSSANIYNYQPEILALPHQEINCILQPISYSEHKIKPIIPAGGIYSTVIDMAQWIIMYLNRGTYNNQQIIGTNSLKELLKPMTIENEFKKPSYSKSVFQCAALGWFIYDWDNHLIVGHSGGCNGMRCITTFIPSEKFGFVILTNSELPLHRVLSHWILDQYFKVVRFIPNDKGISWDIIEIPK